MPAPIGISCDLCGKKFFSKSLPIHRKQCQKKFDASHTQCKKCLRQVSNDEIDKHQAECKVVRKVAAAKPKIVKERPIKAAKDCEEGSSSEESSDEEDYREQCGFCNRKFNPDRIAKHESICASNASRKKRKQFKSATQTRLEGTDFEKYMDPNKRRQVELPASGKWRQDHDRLQGIVEQGRLVKAFQDAGVPLTQLPAPGTDLKQLVEGSVASGGASKEAVPEGYEKCPHCSRTFAENTAKKHIPKCKTTINKPKKLVRKSQVVLEKPREDHSGVIKTLISKVLKMTTKKSEFFETKEAMMFVPGEKVTVKADGRLGTVRYVGRVSELFAGYWLGLELDEPKGNNNGAPEGGFQYFMCAKDHGLYIRPSKVRKHIVIKPATPPKKEQVDTKKADEKSGKDTDAKEKPVKKAAEKAAKEKKAGMVERLRSEVKLNSPRKPDTKQKQSKPSEKKEQRPEVEDAPSRKSGPSAATAKKKPVRKENPAKKAKEARLAKDVAFLEQLHGKTPAGGANRCSSREELSSSAQSFAGAGQSLGSVSSAKPAKAATSGGAGASKESSGGPNRPDRAARAAYFEKMFAQK